MKKITLTQRKFTIIDDEDFEYLNQWKWQFGGRRYAVRTINHSGKIYMHKIIIKVPKGMETDHINGDGLDNRRNNLRIVSVRENQLNSRPHKNTLSGLKGVYLRRKDNKWVVYINRQFKGAFFDRNEAARIYNYYAKEIYKDYAYLNKI